MISQNEGLSEEEIKKLFSMTAEVGLNKKEGETLLSIQKELADLLLKIYFNSLIIHDDTIALDEKVKISQLLLLDKSLQGYATGRQNKPLEEEPNKEQVATVDLDEDEEDSIDKILEMKNSKHHLDFYALMIQKGARGFLARRTFTRLKNTESILVMVKVFVQREETLACAIMKRASVNEYTVYAYNDDSNYYFHPQHVNMQLFGANDSKRLCLDYKIYEKVFEQTYFDMDSTRLYPHDYLMEEFSAHANPLVRIDSNERYKAEFLIQKALRKERKGRVDRLIPRIESNFILVGKRFMFYQHLPVSLLFFVCSNSLTLRVTLYNMKLREEITSLSFFSIVPKANFTTLLKVVKKIFYKVTAEGEDDRITISIPETQELLTYRDDDFSTFQLACTKLLQQYYRKRNLFSRTLIVQQGKEYLFEVHFLSKTKKIIIKIYDQAFKDQTEMDESVAKEHYINEISRKSSFHNISSLNPNKNKYELVRLLKINFSDIYLEDKNLSKLDKYKIADFILERKIIFQFKTFMIGTITEAEINEILQEEHPKLAEWVKQTIKEVSGILPAEKTSELYNELVKPLPPVKGMKALKIFQQKALSRVSRKYPSKSGSQSSALPSPKVQAPKKPFTLKNFNPKTGRRKGLRPIGYKLPIRRLDSDQSHSKGDLISDMGDQSPPGIVYSSAGYLQQSKRRIEREEEELEQQMKLERERSSSGEIQIIDQGENVKLLSDIKLAFGIQEHDFENEDSDEEIKESTPVARKSSFENEVIQPDNPMDLLSPIQASRFSQGRAASSRRSGIEANGGNKIEFLIDSKRESLDNQEGNEDIELEPPRAHFGFKVQHTSTEPVKSLMSDIKNIRNTLQVKDRLAKIVDDSHVGTTSRRERDFKIGSRHNSRIVRGTSRTNSRLSNDSIKKDHSQNSNRPLANKSIIQVKKMELDPEITSKQSKDLSRSKLDEPSIKAPPSIRASLSRTKMEMKSNTALEPQPTELNPPTKRSFDRADLNSPSEAPEEPQTDQQLVRLNAQSARVDESPFKGKKHRSVINVIIQSPHPSESFNPADSPAVHARSGLLAPKRKLSSHIDSIASPQVKKDTRDNKSVRETSRQSNRNLATSTPASKPFSFAANRSPLGVRIDHKSPTLQVTNVTLGKSRSTSATKMADRKKNFLKEVEKNDRAGLKITTPLEIKPRKVTQNSSTPPSATTPAKIERIIINPPMENSQNSASQPPNFFQPLKKMRLKDKSDKE